MDFRLLWEESEGAGPVSSVSNMAILSLCRVCSISRWPPKEADLQITFSSSVPKPSLWKQLCLVFLFSANSFSTLWIKTQQRLYVFNITEGGGNLTSFASFWLWLLIYWIKEKEREKKICVSDRILHTFFTYVSTVIEIAICPSTFYINALKFLRWYSMFHPLLWQMEETFGIVKCLYGEQSLLTLKFYLEII